MIAFEFNVINRYSRLKLISQENRNKKPSSFWGEGFLRSLEIY